MKKLAAVLFFVGLSGILLAQDCQVLGHDYLQIATFGNMSAKSCVDDDFSQTLFFTVPESLKGSFYIRVFDPDCGGEHDLSLGLWETNTSFEIYGGKGCISESDARSVDPKGNYKSGTLLARGLFAEESIVDGTWIAFGPFKAEQGESLNEFKGYSFFKLLVEGSTGDDGNMYKVCVSKSAKEYQSIKYATIFHYEIVLLNNESLKLDRSESIIAMHEGIQLPVTLEPIDPARVYELLITPEDE